MTQTKEIFVDANVNTNSILQYPFGFCSHVPFTGTVSSRNWHLLFVPSLFISNLTFVFMLLSLLVTHWCPSILIFRSSFFRFMIENNFSQKYVHHVPNIFGEIINNYWT